MLHLPLRHSLPRHCELPVHAVPSASRAVQTWVAASQYAVVRHVSELPDEPHGVPSARRALHVLVLDAKSQYASSTHELLPLHGPPAICRALQVPPIEAIPLEGKSQ